MGKNYEAYLKDKVNELENINQILTTCGQRILDQLKGCSSGVSFFDAKKYFPGFEARYPDRWIGWEVNSTTHPEYGTGVVVAILQVYNHQYLPGVEFNREIYGGHSLSFREEGIQGKSGRCLWCPVDTLTVVFHSRGMEELSGPLPLPGI